MMNKPEFVHLHNHSEYSLLDGVTRWSGEKGLKGAPSDLLRGMASDGVKAVALTDHGNLYGAMEFYKKAIELDPDNLTVKEKAIN